MSERRTATEWTGTRVLEPVGGFDRTGTPTSFRVRRVPEPEPRQPSRLLYLPPVWTRASFWLPVAPVPAPTPPSAPQHLGPHDDFAA